MLRYHTHKTSAASQVLGIEATSWKQQAPAYDFVIHVRTLGLIEDMSNRDGLPVNATGKAANFLASEGFESMVQCFAREIYAAALFDLHRATKKAAAQPGPGPGPGPVSIYVATDGADLRAEFTARLGAAVGYKATG